MDIRGIAVGEEDWGVWIVVLCDQNNLTLRTDFEFDNLSSNGPMRYQERNFIWTTDFRSFSLFSEDDCENILRVEGILDQFFLLYQPSSTFDNYLNKKGSYILSSSLFSWLAYTHPFSIKSFPQIIRVRPNVRSVSLECQQLRFAIQRI